MRRVALVAVLVGLAVLAPAVRSQAQQVTGTLEALRDKPAISDDERQQIRRWVAAVVNTLVTSQDADRRGMVAAREAIVTEGRKDATRSPAFLDAFGPEAVAAIKDGLSRAVGQDARVNLLMAAADLRRIEGIPLLQTAIEKEPYAASRYWAARGLAMVADDVVAKTLPRIEAEVAESIGRALESETSTVVLLQMFDTLGRFDHEKAHDVLADGATKLVQRSSASDSVAVQIMDGAVKALQRAYAREARPEIKQHILMAYATMCVWVMPPAADPALMSDLNASIEQITGEKVGFNPAEDPVLQKLSLLEWVERFVRDKRIPKRPAMPPAVESAVKELKASAAPAGGA